MKSRKKMFLTNYVGLASRLETLHLAFYLKDKFGHEIVLQWPDLDDFSVDETTPGKRRFYHRFDSYKILKWQESDLETIPNHKHLVLRTQFGPDFEELSPYYIESAKKIRLNEIHKKNLMETFLKYEGRPIVGVHVRRGDFPAVNEDHFDASVQACQAVPLWWYRNVIDDIIQQDPSTVFFLSHNGSAEEIDRLVDGVESFTLPVPKPHFDRSVGHAAEGNAVADLFALACCKLLIATPCSSFSSFAANALGEPTSCILPATRTEQSNPRYGLIELYGRPVMHDWHNACREGDNWAEINEPSKLKGLLKPASLNWL